jgi:hypothetical protein
VNVPVATTFSKSASGCICKTMLTSSPAFPVNNAAEGRSRYLNMVAATALAELPDQPPSYWLSQLVSIE